MTTKSDLTRLNVNLNQETVDALKELSESRGASFTEVVRRSILLYAYLDFSIDNGGQVILRARNGKEREIVIL